MFAFADVFDFFVHEFARLRRWRFALFSSCACSFDGSFFWHDSSLPTTRIARRANCFAARPKGDVLGARREYTVNAQTMLVSTRRTFLKATAASFAAPYAFAQAPKITTASLGDNLYLLSGAGGDVVARTGAGGVVLVDGGLVQNADALAQAVAALPNSGPVRTLFNTHWHPSRPARTKSSARREPPSSLTKTRAYGCSKT